MWRPRTWTEIQALPGQAEESSSLDFKRELTANGRETSKDIAAMTLNGGVLIYGVDEDKATRTAAAVTPMALAQVEEKLRNIAGTRIVPTPDFDVELVRNPADPATGVVVVVIPPSPLAPHQWDHRYPVRRGTTTEYLTEPEVERLYRQRQALSERPPSAQDLLAEFQAAPNLPRADEGDVGIVELVIRPASTEVSHPAGAWQEKALHAAASAAAQRQASRLANASRVRDTWNEVAAWQPLEAEGWFASRAQHPISGSVEKQITATLTYPARLSFLAQYGIRVRGPAGRPSYKVAREDDLVYDLLALLAVAGEYFSGVDGGGQLLTAIRLRGFGGAESQFAREGGWLGVLPGAPDAMVRQARTTAIAVRDEPELLARRLIDIWLPAFFRDPQPDERGPRDLLDVLVPRRHDSAP
jgi:hypothetical protein